MTAPWTIVWFYNSYSGSVVSEPAFGDTIQAHLPGWHGPFGTKQEALDFYSQNQAANPGWKAPTGLGGAVTNAVKHDAGSVPGLTGLAAIGDCFTKLGSANLWMRVGEVLAGLILLGIGVNALFHGQPLRAVTNTAGAVGRIVP